MAVVAQKLPSARSLDPDRGPLLDLIADVVPDAKVWLQTANSAFGGQAPQQLIGTPQEEQVRDLVLAYKYGIPT